MYPADLKYSKDHEWIRVSGDTGQVGITDYAQKQLGDVVYVELPEVGQTFGRGVQFGSIESVKAVSDLYCPMAGTVVKVNTTLVDRPETVNADPHGAWIIAIELTRPDQTAGLIDAAAETEELVAVPRSVLAAVASALGDVEGASACAAAVTVLAEQAPAISADEASQAAGEAAAQAREAGSLG